MAGAWITNPGYDLEQQKVRPEVPTLLTIRDNKIHARRRGTAPLGLTKIN
jgi:hypothetical protein